jgi:hypothetical protein
MLSQMYDIGFAACVIVKGQADFAAATYEGMREFCRYCGNAQTVNEAIENRYKMYSQQRDQEAFNNTQQIKRTA